MNISATPGQIFITFQNKVKGISQSSQTQRCLSLDGSGRCFSIFSSMFVENWSSKCLQTVYCFSVGKASQTVNADQLGNTYQLRITNQLQKHFQVGRCFRIGGPNLSKKRSWPPLNKCGPLCCVCRNGWTPSTGWMDRWKNRQTNSRAKIDQQLQLLKLVLPQTA